ncbi:hypothetical protein [uncultured Draconibacterium sp.]|uniref:hypothetical protein n=1 Tax=uncultured Draconibacterium sp. TaxID=1573823 RepID=UPI0029C83224|nr:hypothetical protein [uncultured Draconibacterium sp.]
MKRFILIVFISVILYACENKEEKILTGYDWEIEKVIDLGTGAINQTGKDNEKIWSFASDNTYRYKTKADGNENLVKGEWQLDNFNLLIHNEFDSTKIYIEKLNSEEMVWLVQGNDSLRFYLNSKAKHVEVPNFPNTNKQ